MSMLLRNTDIADPEVGDQEPEAATKIMKGMKEDWTYS
jgi:hypothetical protein